MPIKGLTDRSSLKPRLARLGKLRKGGEKTGNRPGQDLPHFRFTSDNPAVSAAFEAAYGTEPKLVNAVLFYETTEENFATWIECWDASGLVFRSDGEHWVLWREGDQYKRGKKPHQDREGQVEVGRLEFLVPELLQDGYIGTITMETHSNHDLRNIASTLMAVELDRGNLRLAEFAIRRVPEEISVPGYGDRKGKRSKATKYLVKVEPRRAAAAALLGAPVADVPELEDGTIEADYEETPALPATVEPEPGSNPEDVRTPKGTRLGDMSLEQLEQLVTWCKANPGDKANELLEAASAVVDARNAEPVPTPF